MSRGKTVLLVDSDLAALTVYSEGLQREGFRVHTAEDGGEAMLQLAALPIDIIVMAAVLPSFSGLEVLKRMRDDDVLQNVPAIILTDTSTQARTDLSGVNRFLLRKDASLSGLMNTIHEFTADPPEKKKAASRKAKSGNSDMATSNTLTSAAVGLETLEVSAESAALFKEVAAALPKIREDCLGYVKAPKTAPSQQHLASLKKRIETLEEHAQVCENGCIATLLKPFNSLLTSLASKNLEAGPSILQTLTQAVDCLALVTDYGKDNVLDSLLKPQALVVDDDPISGDVNVTALQQANFDTTSIEDPVTALNILAGTPFDLIVLDVNMPKMNGFELCEKLRQLPQGKTTPVIFLTAFNNFENRKKSVLSGGGDFITKPVSTRELALKATIHLLKAQIRAAKEGTGSNPAQFIASDLRTPSAAPRPLEASALLSATESATSSVGNTEFLTVIPAITAPLETQPKKEKSVKPQRNGHAEIPPLAMAASVPEPKSAAPDAAAAELLAKFEKERTELTQRAETAEAKLKEIHEQSDKSQSELESVRALIEEKTARTAELEKQFAELQAAHKELQSKLSTGETVSAKSQSEIDELQTKLQQKSTELERIQTELEKASAEKSRLEAELRSQAQEAQAAAAKAEAVLKERDDSYKLLEDELVALRKVRDQLQQKQQQSAAELTRAKSDLAQQAAERARLDSELRAELAAAKHAVHNAESSLKEKEESYHLLEEELAPLRKARDQFQQKQQQNAAELARLKSELERETEERAKSEAELSQQLEASKQSIAQVESALKDSADRCLSLDSELKTAAEERENLHKQHQQALANLQQVEGELGREVVSRSKVEAELKESTALCANLESDLESARREHKQLTTEHQQALAQLETLKGELTHEKAERAQVESELGAKLDATQQSLARTEADLKEATTQCTALESELKSARTDFNQLQKQHQHSTAELERVQAELAKEIADRAKAEAKLQEQLEAATARTAQFEESLKEQEARSLALEKDIATSRKEHEQLGARFDATTSELKQTKAALEKESAHRVQLETDCEELTASKNALAAERAQLEKKLAAAEARILETEQKLQESASALAQATSELDKERKKHQRTEQRADALAGRLRGLHGELSKYLSEEPHSSPAE